MVWCKRGWWNARWLAPCIRGGQSAIPSNAAAYEPYRSHACLGGLPSRRAARLRDAVLANGVFVATCFGAAAGGGHADPSEICGDCDWTFAARKRREPQGSIFRSTVRKAKTGETLA